MYKRTYFTKDNLIIYKSEFNFGNFPLVDLFYGGGGNDPKFSRYIFHFDVDDLQAMYENCQLGNLSAVKHTLKFKHSGFTETGYACMPNSYKVCLFKLDQPWNEGCGVDVDCSELCTAFARLGCAVDKGPSNWYFSQSGVTWDAEGPFSNVSYVEPEYISCQEIFCNSPDLEIDVTTLVNNLILDDSLNFGYGLAFHFDDELELSDIEKHVVFFGRETNTFFEPFLETEYVNAIYDDRAQFYLDKPNRLYLYPTVNGEPTKLDALPTVEIYDQLNQLQYSMSAICQDLGVYYVEFTIPSASISKCYAWTDKWRSLAINGKDISDQSFKFNLLPADQYYGFSYNTPIPETNFSFGFRGIKRDEIIRQGDIRKIFVDIKSPSNPHKIVTVDNVFFKLYIRQGPYDELVIIDWMPVNRGVCENWFLLDTSWMIPQAYILDFKVVNKQTVTTYPEKIKFNVIEKPIFF